VGIGSTQAHILIGRMNYVKRLYIFPPSSWPLIDTIAAPSQIMMNTISNINEPSSPVVEKLKHNENNMHNKRGPHKSPWMIITYNF
jgi:ArsR family metal-binding transcriptional regulator